MAYEILVLVLSCATSQGQYVHNRSFWRMLSVTHQTQFSPERRIKIKADAVSEDYFALAGIRTQSQENVIFLS